MLRSMGAAAYGAVRVMGGAEYVMLPRLPNDPPPPARANAKLGANDSAKTAAEVRRNPVRRIVRSTFRERLPVI